MNRRERRIQQRLSRENVAGRSHELTPVPESEWPPIEPRPIKVWLSRKYLVQLYTDANPAYPGLLRLSVCRGTLNAAGRWNDRLTWDELQAIKREIGFGEWYGVEIYPPDHRVVNVANMRHLWLLPTPLPIGW